MTNKYLKNSPAKRVDIGNKKIFMGFWHNWNSAGGDGYRYGTSAIVKLSEVPKEYNVVAVSFMKGAGIPTFTPNNMTTAEFRAQVDILHERGQTVLISLGGADGHIELQNGQENALAAEIIRLVDTYGFDGLDIDLEQDAIYSIEKKHQNHIVIPNALIQVRKHYAGLGEHFIISMAPEFPYLEVGREYSHYINALEGYYDFIAPQYYNQGGAGVWVAEIEEPRYINQNDDERKEDFLYYLTESLVTGTRGLIKIPADKFVIGLPSNIDAANNGYVIDKKDVYNAFARLDSAGLSIKGLMTWSINWDIGKSAQGVSYNWEFKNRYAALIHSDAGNSNNLPLAPYNLAQKLKAETSIGLAWEHQINVNSIREYTVFRDGVKVGTSINKTFTDNGLEPNKQYTYKVSATDTQGQISDLSAPFTAITLTSSLSIWVASQWYRDNDVVRHNAQNYICVMQHTSNEFWSPDQATTLWQLTVQR
ncbi:glycosyl hydrolase family 18 protein [Yersinia pekkanenii]|uniref:chitinase n=1 Tax=Yersinia pekkanenii TaxID=1288385 RepID=A0A0T9Q9D6_9GAMM|nr:glycosyl hydrolase family 18 protein [Yersinia pekkanenii]CNI01869.1 glycosyl hydrolase family protein [Yersinia pekkanenii]CRY63650.1 glycosyl hydrolase family protein [Yersinia pekkanenii]